MMAATSSSTCALATNFTSVPIIDVAAITSDQSTHQQRLEAAKALGDAAEKIGFFQIINHGIEVPLHVLDFFSKVSLDAKMKLAQRHHQISNTNRYRGYFPLIEGNSSYKEGIEFGPERYELKLDYEDTSQANRHRLLLHESNVWPDETAFPEIKGFRESIGKYYKEMLRLGGQLMTGLALALGLPENYFDSSFTHSVSTLRLLEYPVKPPHVIAATPADSVGISCGQHTDSGILTLLYQDEVGGLQVRNAAGDWIDVPPTKGALVINLGDLLQRWTNNKWISTVHRVKEGSKLRHSIPFFFEPSFDCVVSTLAPCRNADGTSPYEDVVYGRYVIEKMQSFIEYRDLFAEENSKSNTSTRASGTSNGGRM